MHYSAQFSTGHKKEIKGGTRQYGAAWLVIVDRSAYNMRDHVGCGFAKDAASAARAIQRNITFVMQDSKARLAHQEVIEVTPA